MEHLLADLVTLKVALGEPAEDSTNDAKYTQSLAAASNSVRKWADRSFVLQEEGDVPTTRRFEYDGGGFLEIDDCTRVDNVTQGGLVLPSHDWEPGPLNEPVSYYLKLLYGGWSVESPQMGFRRNLDTRAFHPVPSPILSVAALWGWNEIPEDVVQAVIWTAVALNETPKPYVSESIEGYSRTLGPVPDFIIPPRAQAALANYARIRF